MLPLSYIGWFVSVVVVTLASYSPRACCHEALVGVAANFAEAGQELKTHFELNSPHFITLVTGATGQLYAQISNGAPFDMLLAADQVRPSRLVDQGYALADSRFTYALGTLTLWSVDPKYPGDNAQDVLRAGEFRHLAIANPDLAPYGVAAQQVLLSLGLRESLQEKIVQGQNVAQTFSLVATGNAELGLVALSHVISRRNESGGVRWDLPAELYSPIRQDAVLLARGADNPAARSFHAFLQSQQAKSIITHHGYGTE